jgi:hypothetical protein
MHFLVAAAPLFINSVGAAMRRAVSCSAVLAAQWNMRALHSHKLHHSV